MHLSQIQNDRNIFMIIQAAVQFNYVACFCCCYARSISIAASLAVY